VPAKESVCGWRRTGRNGRCPTAHRACDGELDVRPGQEVRGAVRTGATPMESASLTVIVKGVGWLTEKSQLSTALDVPGEPQSLSGAPALTAPFIAIRRPCVVDVCPSRWMQSPAARLP